MAYKKQTKDNMKEKNLNASELETSKAWEVYSSKRSSTFLVWNEFEYDTNPKTTKRVM